MATWVAGSSSSSGSRIADDVAYVAVGKDYEENKLNLLWAVENFPGNYFFILHVHQPAKMIPLVGGKFPADRLEQNELREFYEVERKIMRKILDDYLLLCHQVEVDADTLCVEMDDIGRGIVELIYQYDIKKLVMGAAANRHYSEEMMDLKSMKAKYVQHRAPHSCQIWYICKGYLIHTREGDSTCSYTNGYGDSAYFMRQRTEGAGLELELSEVPQSEEDSSLEGSNIDQLSDQLEQASLEAEKFRKEAYEESVRRGEAERKAFKAFARAKALESLYAKELRYRKETEEALAREKENHQRTKNQRDEERLITMDQRLLQQLQTSDFDSKIKELNDERLSSMEQCKEYKKQRDELLIERDNLLKLAQELAEKEADEASCSQIHQSLSVFSLSEIKEATCDFDPLLRIGETRHGSIYKGVLHHTPVAIKVINPCSTEVSQEFQQEVDLMSNLRHPNLVMLIGACTEARALIYEYLPNGSLEDRLRCKDNSPPLPWQTRIQIASELCSVLIFLHSNNPHSILHGDLESRNILLDANFSCKVSDFGICQSHSLRESFRYIALYNETDSRGSFSHLDPHFLRTGELSPKSDTYSFGIILLQLLTGRSSLSIVREIKDVIEGNLNSLLDPLAGDWPFAQAKQLARLASSCCGMNPSSRPDLASEAWGVLEPMRASCSGSVQGDSQENQQPPSYFMCPIFQEVMQDPHIAADGFTYEAEALTGWLRSGHSTSPMTNLELEHLNLVPNRALRSAIQEWLEQQ